MDASDGEFLVKLARKAISEYIDNGDVIPTPTEVKKGLKEKRGVFVTLTTHPEKRLRGCIGLPEPVKPLVEAVIDAAISSATKDPRFYPVSIQELSQITIEVTVLTRPKLIAVKSPEERLDLIELGRHGLIIEKGLSRGLLLPQVPVEQGWSIEEFMEGLCMKAGLSSDSWKKSDTKLYSFEGIIFSEVAPGGDVVKREI
jgi:uncharacterized protein (TIGR00296 family)